MAFEFSVKNTIDKARDRLTELEKEQIPFATASAITKTVFQMKDTAAPASMRQDMAAPERYTLAGVRYKRATKQTLRGSVFIDAGRVGYLSHPAKGNARTPQTFPYVMVPVGLSRLQAGGRTGRVLSSSLARTYRSQLLADGKHFEGRINGTMGIWARVDDVGKINREGRRVKLIVLYLPRTHYRSTWHFYKAMTKYARLNFPTIFNRQLHIALATARPQNSDGGAG